MRVSRRSEYKRIARVTGTSQGNHSIGCYRYCSMQCQGLLYLASFMNEVVGVPLARLFGTGSHFPLHAIFQHTLRSNFFEYTCFSNNRGGSLVTIRDLTPCRMYSFIS